MNQKEIEVKFFLSRAADFRVQVARTGAGLLVPRVHELNLRFDTPDLQLAAGRRVLRLRMDDTARMTYKDPAEEGQAVSVRREIEFAVSDFHAAQDLLEALGYEVSAVYEKYRTTYQLLNAHVTLDEMPYGNFVEIEGPDEDTIREVSKQLQLNWEARITVSYLELFARLKGKRSLAAGQLTFAAFEGVTIHPDDLGVQVGDAG